MKAASHEAEPSPISSRKRPLAKRSCLNCREKKARCELPDVYVDSSKVPLPTEKKCHRCDVLGVTCVVWDGDRKRRPRLEPPNESKPRGTVQEGGVSPASSSKQARTSPETTERDQPDVQPSDRSKKDVSSAGLHRRSDGGGSSAPSRSVEAEQLRASDLKHAQQLLINRQKGWKAMSRTLYTLMERLQNESRYSNYLKLRIDAPPSTPDIATFLPLDRVPQFDIQLQDYLVEHPHLPSLSVLQQQQSQNATRPRALLLATLILLGLKGTHDELASADTRTLSSYIDRLGTQLLFSSPRDIHLVMAFELLLAHEPGLVGTAASQFEPEGRGFGLASENLLTCAIKVAKELRLDSSLTVSQHTPDSLARLSLWCCLRTWDGVYAFLGEKFNIMEDLNQHFATTVRRTIFCVDDSGTVLPSPPRLRDASGSISHSYQEMREFCAQSEQRLGRDGILRSAGRTVLSMRVEAVCYLFSSLHQLQETLSNADLSLEEKQQRTSDITAKTYDSIMGVRHNSHEDLGE